MQLLIDIIKNNDPKNNAIKRVAIDTLYSIGAFCGKEMTHRRDEVLAILDECRADKFQPIRSSAQDAIRLLKDIPSKATKAKP